MANTTEYVSVRHTTRLVRDAMSWAVCEKVTTQFCNPVISVNGQRDVHAFHISGGLTMSRQKYDRKCDKLLLRLANTTATTTNDDEVIEALTRALEVLGRDYASIR